MNSFSKIISIFISVIIIFIFPMLYMAQKSDSIATNYVSTTTAEFIDAVKNSGYITKTMYSEYTKKLSATGNIYSVKIEHAHQVINPVYDDNNVFTNNFNEHFYNTYEDDILKELYEGSGTYTFNQGDYISIKIANINKTLFTKLYEMIISHEINKNQILVSYGGVIRDENY